MESEKRPVGRPPNHRPIIDLTTGNVYATYAEAARAVGGFRNKVYLCCMGIQSQHHGHKFAFLKGG